MKKVTFLLASVILASSQAYSASPESPTPYTLQVISMSKTEPIEFIYTVGRVGFRTLADLRNFIQTMPKGSVLRYAPSCRTWSGEPLRTDKEIQALRAFCQDHGIVFQFIPAG